MATLIAATVLAGAAAAAAIALAPAALADRGDRGGNSSADSSSRGSVDRDPHKATPAQRGGAGAGPARNQLSPNFAANLPPGWKNEALWAGPGGSNPFGKGPKPPVVALD